MDTCKTLKKHWALDSRFLQYFKFQFQKISMRGNFEIDEDVLRDALENGYQTNFEQR